MKKGLFFLGIAAMTLASCSQEELIDINNTAVNGNAISFRAHTGKATRAMEYSSTNLDDFMVYGYKGDIDDANDTMVPYFLDGKPVKFTRETGGLLFTSETPYYYPVDGSWLTFLAYAPSSMEMQPSGDRGGIKNSFTVDADINKQIDLIFASSGSNLGPEDDDMELTFSHALSKVYISELRNKDTRFKYEIAGVKFGNIHNSGDVEYFGELWQQHGEDDQNEVMNEKGYIANEGGQIFCKPTGEQTDEIEYIFAAPKVLDKDATSVEIMTGVDTEGTTSEAFMLFPQQLSKNYLNEAGDGVNGKFGEGMSYIALLVRITNTITGDVIYPYEEGVDAISKTLDGVTYAWAAFPIASLWVPGNYMDYLIDLSNGAGFVAPGATEHEYEAIFGRQIKFYETVDDWNNGGDVTVTEEHVIQVDEGGDDDPFND